jgi:hypothetical protein
MEAQEEMVEHPVVANQLEQQQQPVLAVAVVPEQSRMAVV